MDTYFYRFIFMLFLFLLSILMFLVLLTAASLSSLQQPLCHDDERSALLQFKDSFILNKNITVDPSGYPKVASWTLEGGTSSDCCSWDGVDCNEDTGHVIGLDLASSWLYGFFNSSNSLFRLLQLQRLNLADNHFNGSQIPFRVGNLLRLTYLNLSFSVFSGQIPSELSHLSKLSSLDLSRNPSLYTLSDLSSLVQNFTNLEELLLPYINFSSPIPECLANLSSLTTLDLENCELHGEFPTRIFQLPNLRDLRIGWNPNLTGHLPEFRLGNPLKVLSIGDTSFFGKLSTSFGSIPPLLSNLTQLAYLDLSGNTLTGHIPSSVFANLTQLTHLDLSNNTLTGHIPSSLLANLTQFTHLDLSYNKLNGTLEFDMFLKIKSLTYLDLSSNNLTLLTKPNSNDTLPQFHTLRLGSCNLQKFPDFLRSQNKLSELDLGGNNLEGLVPKWMYNASRESLNTVILSNNFLIGFEQSPVVLPWSNLTSLYLDNNWLQGSLPIPPPSIRNYRVQRNLIREMSPLICNLSSLVILDLSYNSLSGMLHPCLGNFNTPLKVLRLRSNSFNGTIPKTWGNGSNLTVIDLSENQLQGQLPSSMANYRMLRYLNVGNNQINGIFPFWLVCNLSSLEVLDLSYNNLSGMLHPCLGNFSSPLSVLQLQSNSFCGPIPKTWAMGSNLTVIDLSENQFRGQLPRSMANCLMLEFLHVGNNQINDTFPFWLGALSQLKVLDLHSNAFHGAIKNLEINYTFLELHIINLSQNSFSGNLPIEYFLHWNAMKVVGANQLKYMEVYSKGGWFTSVQCTITITNKGRMLNYEKIPDVFRVIDFSSNRFEGEIPYVLGSLKGLHLLNLSNNALTGHIPSSLGNLKQVESMDLSQNKLSGPIPSQLAELNFLSSFNVSNNRLTGPIPHGGQFDTFENGSFSGNIGLCGKPLPKQCNPFPRSTSEENQGSKASFEFDWKVVVAGYGCGLIVGAVIGKFVSIRKNNWFMKTFGKRQQTPRRVNRRM